MLCFLLYMLFSLSCVVCVVPNSSKGLELKLEFCLLPELSTQSHIPFSLVYDCLCKVCMIECCSYWPVRLRIYRNNSMPGRRLNSSNTLCRIGWHLTAIKLMMLWKLQQTQLLCFTCWTDTRFYFLPQNFYFLFYFLVCYCYTCNYSYCELNNVILPYLILLLHMV